MRLTVTRRLNAHFVDVPSPLRLASDRHGVHVTITTQIPDDGGFASIICSGSMDLAELEPPSKGLPLDAARESAWPRWMSDEAQILDVHSLAGLADGLDHLDGVLEHIGSLIRWRFGLSGRDSVFADFGAEVLLDDGQVLQLRPIPQAALGDDRAAIGEPGWSELAGMVASEFREPIAHQLLREAWNLRFANPRSSLVIGVAAAEVGMKQLVANLVPDARSLVEDLPAPPLARMMKHSLPELPIRAAIEPERRCPKHLHKALDLAVQERNAVVHRGAEPAISLRETLVAVREFLYLLDLYEGNIWATEQLSATTRASLGMTAADE